MLISRKVLFGQIPTKSISDATDIADSHRAQES